MGEEGRPNRGPVLLIIMVVIILILLWLLVPNISKITNPENEKDESEDYEYFEEFEGENIMVYKNENLNVTLTYEFAPRSNTTSYVAEWVNVRGRSQSQEERSPEALYDKILREAQDMTVDQIRWYEFMIQEIIE